MCFSVNVEKNISLKKPKYDNELLLKIHEREQPEKKILDNQENEKDKQSIGYAYKIEIIQLRNHT